MAWRLVKSLDTLRSQVRAAAPRAVPPATPTGSWGTIGDAAHSSSSDHSPHVYAALGPVPVVCAADFPHAPALGLDAGAFTEALRQSRDPRIAYVIFNGRIFSSTNTPWIWRTYTGGDQHRTHWHVSVVHTAAADDTSPWRMPSGASTGDGTMADASWNFNDMQKAKALWGMQPKVVLDTDGTINGTGALAEFDTTLIVEFRRLVAKVEVLAAEVAGLADATSGAGVTAEQARAIAREEISEAEITPRPEA